MKKLKTFVIGVEVKQTYHVVVNARSEKSAREKLSTEDGWREAASYHEGDLPFVWDDKTMAIGSVHEVS